MSFIIDGYDFSELDAEKYWSFPKTYKGDRNAETKMLVTSGDYLVSLKNDGHYFRFIKAMDGTMRLQGRTRGVGGDFLDKLDHVPQLMSFFESLPNGTCLLGEIYFPSKRGSRNVTTIMGCLTKKAIERQEQNEMLNYYVFDVYAWAGKSLLDTKFEQRINLYLRKITTDNPYVTIAQYYEGQEAWNKIGEWLSSGLEGAVATKKTALVEPGKRTARKTLKIKMEIEHTIDAFYDGDFKPAEPEYKGESPETWPYYVNEKTGERSTRCMYPEFINGEAWTPVSRLYYYGWASAISFSVMRDGKPYHIGYISGITDEVKAGVVENPEQWIGRVAEISAMEIEKRNVKGEIKYSLRHGTLVNWRTDKEAKDCGFDQIG